MIDDNNTNRRVIMTKRLLKDSLVECMKKKPIHSISIKEICDRAQVNRSTFYRHYDTQFDLYDDIISDVVNDILDISQKHKDDHSEIMVDILTYIETHRDMCLTLLSENGSLSIGETFSDLVTNVLANLSQENERSEMDTYVVQFISAGVASIVWKWLNSEERIPAKRLARIIMVLTINRAKPTQFSN